MTSAEIEAAEAAIAHCVTTFYGRARQDPLLGPVFNAEVLDWDEHLRTISNFWSKALLKTDRYSGHPYVKHVKLPIRPEHIDRWLELFAETVRETLPEPLAEGALAKARMMGDSFRMGLFPITEQRT